MRKTIILAFIALILLSPLMVSAREIWKFDNFTNFYRVYEHYNCYIDGGRACPSEFGWQGNLISFIFPLERKPIGMMKFNFQTDWFINAKPIDIYVNDYHIAENFMVSNTGLYSFPFPAKYLRVSDRNVIKIVMRDIHVGYGYPSAGFILEQVSLDRGLLG